MVSGGYLLPGTSSAPFPRCSYWDVVSTFRPGAKSVPVVQV